MKLSRVRPLRGGSAATPQAVASVAVTVVATLLAAGCATRPSAADEIAASAVAIGQIDRRNLTAGAVVDIAMAHEKLARARVAMARKDDRHAVWLAQEARVDAELANVTAAAATPATAGCPARVEGPVHVPSQRPPLREPI